MAAAAKTASPPSLAQVAERALDACRRAAEENELLRDELKATRAKARKAVTQAEKAIPMMRRSQAKLKQALAANARLEERLSAAEDAAAEAAERARLAEEMAESAVAHARTA